MNRLVSKVTADALAGIKPPTLPSYGHHVPSADKLTCLMPEGWRCLTPADVGFLGQSSSGTHRMIKFVLMVNQQGQTRLSRYYEPVELSRRAALEADAVRCCLSRKKDQVQLS